MKNIRDRIRTGTIDPNVEFETINQHLQAGALDAAENLLCTHEMRFDKTAKFQNLSGILESKRGNHAEAFERLKLAAKYQTEPSKRFKMLRNMAIAANTLKRFISLSLIVRELEKLPESKQNIEVLWFKCVASIHLHQHRRLRSALWATLPLAFQHRRMGAFLGIISNLIVSRLYGLVKPNYRQAREIAELLVCEGRWMRAHDKMQHAFTLPGAQPNEKMGLATTAAAIGRYEEAFETARATFDGILDAEVERFIYGTLADVFAKTNQPTLAQRACEELLEKQGFTGNEETVNLLCSLYENNDAEAALNKLLRRACTAFPDAVWPRYQLAQYLDRNHVFDQALDALQDALMIDPTHKPSMNLLGCVLQSLDQHDQAALVFERMLDMHPNDFVARHNLAWTHNETGRTDEALELYLELHEENPYDSNVLNNLGVACSNANLESASLKCYRQAIEFDPQNTDALRNYALALHEIGSLENAAIYFKRLVKIKPDDATALFHLGNQALRAQNFSSAKTFFERSLALEVFHPDQFNSLAVAHEKCGDMDAANRVVKLGCEHFPDNHILMFNAGLNAFFEGNSEEAIHYYERSIKLYPEYIPALNNLGFVHYDAGNLDKAETYFRRAQECDENHYKSLYNLGSVQFAKSKVIEARKCFQDAYRLAPGFGVAYLMSAFCHLWLGQPDDARSELSKVPKGLTFEGEELSIKALEHLLAGNHDEAITELNGLLNVIDSGLAPKRALHHLMRAIAHKLQDDEAMADEDFRSAYKLLPSQKWNVVAATVIWAENPIEQINQVIERRAKRGSAIPQELGKIKRLARSFVNNSPRLG
ncbi:MAG: tetratricopeptide repeat protein [Roseobacter sp.]